MRIAVNGTHDAAHLRDVVSGIRTADADGLAGYWLGQGFGADALTALAIAAPHAPRLELGVAVVPIWTRSPQALAAQALTTQAATGGRLSLGIGLSHRRVVEEMWGGEYRATAQRAAEYLDALLPLLAGEDVEVRGETLHFAGRMTFDPDVPPPPVLLAALGPRMLRVAGRRTAGTITGSTGPGVLAEYIVPTITAAADDAGRSAPRVVTNVVALVTDDADEAHQWLTVRLADYGAFPSFRAMLDREGVTSQADIALVGPEEKVEELVRQYEAAGVSDLVVANLGRTQAESERTHQLFAALARARAVATP